MKPKIIVGVLLITCALAYLIVGGLKETAVYYMTVPELYARAEQPVGQGMRVSGPLLPESIRWNAEKIELRFALCEAEDTLRVIYHGVPPDQLANAQQVVVEGELLSSGVFLARKLLLKCPSKYETKGASG